MSARVGSNPVLSLCAGTSTAQRRRRPLLGGITQLRCGSTQPATISIKKTATGMASTMATLANENEKKLIIGH
jgi:hypothetical protein